MKFSVIINLTAILLLFTVIGGCQEKEVIIQETYHKNGAVESQIPIVNGKRDGMQKFFYEDGKLASQVLYVQDLKQGQFKAWFHDGKLKLVANYRDSKLQGEATTYYENGKIITGLSEAEQMDDVMVFHAGTAFKDADIVSSGGRVLGVTALGVTIADAKRRAYEAVEKIKFEGAYFRRDIANKAIR